MKKAKSSPIVITIDGPSGTGKGTISQLLAQKLHFHFLDSGAIYRVFAHIVLEESISLENLQALRNLVKKMEIKFVANLPYAARVFLNGKDVTEEIRNENCASFASKFSALPEVREILLQIQRSFLIQPGLVADGRDMGTVVFPDAYAKFFLTATPEVRAERRLKQLQENKINANLSEILQDLTARDRRDSERSCAPLKPADDAVLIDTTKLTIDEVLQKVTDCLNSINLKQ